MALQVVPLTLPAANALVSNLHRHHAALPGGFAWWACGAADADGVVHAAAIAGRPTNRNNDDGQTVEVQRLVSDGHPQACSILYGACAKAARAIGARRIITYTLDSESGASLRAVGWVPEADGIRSYWDVGTTRTPGVRRPHYDEGKVRWVKMFDGVSPLTVQPPQITNDVAPSLPFEETA